MIANLRSIFLLQHLLLIIWTGFHLMNFLMYQLNQRLDKVFLTLSMYTTTVMLYKQKQNVSFIVFIPLTFSFSFHFRIRQSAILITTFNNNNNKFLSQPIHTRKSVYIHQDLLQHRQFIQQVNIMIAHPHQLPHHLLNNSYHQQRQCHHLHVQ